MELNEYLQNYELKVTKLLIEKAGQYKLLEGNLLQSEDLTHTRDKIAPHYLADVTDSYRTYNDPRPSLQRNRLCALHSDVP